MQRLGASSELAPWWWCPRCGSLKAVNEALGCDIAVPYLVDRCRRFEDGLIAPGLTDWHSLGIQESIHIP